MIESANRFRVLLMAVALLFSTTATDARWGRVGLETGSGPATAEFPLSGWDQRIKLTIDSSVVDATLTDFPVMVKISTASGIGDADNTAVFDEISGNSLKIAITSDDETTELYVEIEKWDFDTTNAWIWFKAPTIASGADTIFYLYYDNDHADNTAQVGIVGSTPGTNVWNDSYQGVYHISETGLLARADSTIRSADSFPQNYDGDEDVVGQIDGSDALDSVDQFLDATNLIGGIDTATNGTISMWVNSDADNGDFPYMFIGAEGTYATYCGISFDYGVGDDHITFILREDASTVIRIDSAVDSTDVMVGNWVHVAVSQDGSLARMYTNGVFAVDSTGELTPGAWMKNIYTDATTKADRFDIGTSRAAGGYWNGKIDECRISTAALTASELKAEYNSGNDSFITFGSEETP